MRMGAHYSMLKPIAAQVSHRMLVMDSVVPIYGKLA
jgi:hypothetical protein